MPRKPAPALIGGPYKPPPSEIGYFRGQAISGDTGISGDTILNPLSSWYFRGHHTESSLELQMVSCENLSLYPRNRIPGTCGETVLNSLEFGMVSPELAWCPRNLPSLVWCPRNLRVPGTYAPSLRSLYTSWLACAGLSAERSLASS